LRSFAINVLPVPDTLDHHDMDIAENFVNDAIVSNPDALGALGALGSGKLLGAVRKRIICELTDRFDDADDLLAGQTAEVLLGGVAPLKVKAFHRASGPRGIRRGR